MSVDVAALVQRRGRSVLVPRDVIVAYGGVVCIVFEGFPKPLQTLKQDLSSLERDGKRVLPPENPGAKWPKVSLGALRPDAATSAAVLSCWETMRALRDDVRRLPPIQVDSVSQVTYSCRSLEETTAVRQHWFDAAIPAEAMCTEDSIAFVDGIVSEAFGEPPAAYLHSCVLAKPSFIESYRASTGGETLVSFLRKDCSFDQAPWHAFLERLRHAVNSTSPAYEWFHPDSLHCTIRGM